VSKVLFIADKISEDALEFLAASGDLEVDNRPGLSMPEKLEAVGKADAVIVRSATKVDAELLEAASSLSLVVRAGVGVDNIDLDAATRKGVVVQNVPEGNTRSAAEHTIAMMLALSRNIPEAHRSIKAGEWERGRFVGVELQGKTLGIIGFGKIGRHVAHMAAGLGLEILAHDPFLAPHMAEELGIELVDELGDLASRCDFLTVHVPKTEGTNALIGPDVLGRAKDGLRVINCARGGIVDEAALLEAIENGDAEAEKIWLKSVKDLATAICSFSNILDPEAVILGGGIAKAGDRLFVPLREYLDPLLWKTDDYVIKLLPAQLGDLAGAYGAAANALGV